MTYSVLIQNNITGKAYECANITQSAEFSTTRTGSPGKLSIRMIQKDMLFTQGNSVRFSVDGKAIFVGYIFTQCRDRYGVTDVTCYDQTRYLKANQSFVFEGLSAGQVIRKVSDVFKLKMGTIEDTGYKIPTLIWENKGCLDLINKVVELTTKSTGKSYVFFDDAGSLSLAECKNLKQTTVIGNKSLLTDYSYTTDIDSETYNLIKLVRPNKETGREDLYVARDNENIKAWGALQYFDVVDEEMNAAQINEQLLTMFAYYNRVLKTISIESLGVLGVRAGSLVSIDIPGLDIAKGEFVLLDKVTHKFVNGLHTMSIETRAL